MASCYGRWLLRFVLNIFFSLQWFLDKTGHEGLNNLLAAYPDKSAYAQCVFSFSPGPGHEPLTFVGRTHGTIVPARGPLDFGWVMQFVGVVWLLSYCSVLVCSYTCHSVWNWCDWCVNWLTKDNLSCGNFIYKTQMGPYLSTWRLRRNLRRAVQRNQEHYFTQVSCLYVRHLLWRFLEFHCLTFDHHTQHFVY